MASSHFNNYIVAPNPAPSNAPLPTYVSGSNVVRYSTGTFDVTLPTNITNGTGVSILNLASSNYANSNFTYRVTMNWLLQTATFSATPTGNLSLFINLNTFTNLANTSAYCRANVTSQIPTSAGSMSAVFVGGNALNLYLANDTGVTLNSGTIRVNSFAIETISTSNIVQNSWT